MRPDQITGASEVNTDDRRTQNLWERPGWRSTLLAKAYFLTSEKVAECPGLFVSKLTPTSIVFDADSAASINALPQAPPSR